MKRLTAWVLAMAIAGTSAAQTVNLKKDKVYVNDQPVCIINKKKNGFLQAASYELKSLDEKTVAVLDLRTVLATQQTTYSWYLLRFPELNDSVEMETKALASHSKGGGLFVKTDEALAGLVAKYSLFENGAFSSTGLSRLKNDYSASVRAGYMERIAKEQVCNTAIFGRAKSDSLKVSAVTITLVKIDTAGKNVQALYSIRQGDRELGTIAAAGQLKSFRSESAEYDFSSGIMSLDGEMPMDYVVLSPEGCTIAQYTGTEKTLVTAKDRVAHPFRTIRKFHPEELHTRVEFMDGIGKLLVTYRYL